MHFSQQQESMWKKTLSEAPLWESSAYFELRQYSVIDRSETPHHSSIPRTSILAETSSTFWEENW